jgi:RPA family protein
MSAERPQREVAYRIFAAEFDDADFTFAESDEERAPNYVVTPTGARVNRMFVVGVLTEVEQVSDDVLRARIVDPTGAFVVYAGQYQPEAMAFFDRAEPPMFVAVTGKARTFQPEDSDIIYTSIRPESANEVTAETRDRWVVQTAEQTLDRIETFGGAMDLAERGDALTDALARRGIRPGLAAGIPKAMDHYGTTTGYLAEMRRIALDAARVVADEIDEVEPRNIAPDDEPDVELDLEPSLPETEYGTSDGDAGEEPATEPEPESESGPEPDAEPEPDSEPEVEVDAEPEPEADTEPEPADESDSGADSEGGPRPETADSASEETADVAEETGDGDAVEPDEMYELSEEEREAVESEYGVGFETGNEIQDPGEADMETPDAEEAESESSTTDTVEESAETESKADDESDADTEAESEAEAEPEAKSEPAAEDVESDAGAVDLEDAVVETMSALDEGDGAPRDELVETVASDYDASTADVEEAIQDALMGGRCYESGENRITPI